MMYFGKAMFIAETIKNLYVDLPILIDKYKSDSIIKYTNDKWQILIIKRINICRDLNDSFYHDDYTALTKQVYREMH